MNILIKIILSVFLVPFLPVIWAKEIMFRRNYKHGIPLKTDLRTMDIVCVIWGVIVILILMKLILSNFSEKKELQSVFMVICWVVCFFYVNGIVGQVKDRNK